MRLNLMKFPGGKGNLIKWILSNFPSGYEKMLYIEPFVGAGNIFLNKKPSHTEIINDINEDIFLVWLACQNNTIQRVKTLYYSDGIFDFYKKYQPVSDWSRSEKEYVLRNMSRGGMKTHFAKSNRLRGGKMGDENAWNNKVLNLPKICNRAKLAVISNRPALDCLADYNSSTAFAYLDPPYLHATRVSKKLYANEMSEKDHEELLNFLVKEWRGRFLLSGYDNSLYHDKLKFCTSFGKLVPNHLSQSKSKPKKAEIVWQNY